MGSHRLFTAAFDNVTIGTAVQDIFSLKGTASRGLELNWIHLEAGGVTTPAEIRMRIKRGTGTFGGSTGGTNITPVPIDPGITQTPTIVAHSNDTTQATATAFTTMFTFQWNVLVPFDFLPVPECRPTIDVSQILVLDLPAAISAATIVSGFIVWEEYP